MCDGGGVGEGEGVSQLVSGVRGWAVGPFAVREKEEGGREGGRREGEGGRKGREEGDDTSSWTCTYMQW